MRTEIIQVICAVIGSFGFSFIFHLKRDKLIVASVGGGLTWLFYLLVVHRVNGEFAAYIPSLPQAGHLMSLLSFLHNTVSLQAETQTRAAHTH